MKKWFFPGVEACREQTGAEGFIVSGFLHFKFLFKPLNTIHNRKNYTFHFFHFCIRFVHDIGGKCYLLLEGLQMREEEEETMVDEAELSNQPVGQAVGVGVIFKPSSQR